MGEETKQETGSAQETAAQAAADVGSCIQSLADSAKYTSKNANHS